MSSIGISAQDYLRGIANQALRNYDRGQREGAVLGFLNDTTKHPGTAHIRRQKDPRAIEILMACLGSRESFEEAMLGFAVRDT